MRYLITLLFSLAAVTTCFGQFDKSTTLRATGNFNVVLDGIATNNAGFGLGLDASFFSTKRLQALVEANADRFIGDKLLYIDPNTGKEAKSAAVYSVKLGPQFFLTKHLALSATYGPTWHVIRDFDYTLDYGFKYSLTGFLGQQRRFIAKVFMVNIPINEQPIQYLGIAAGFRF